VGEDETESALNAAKKAIYRNLKKCPFHIQGCLIAEDGRHLKLDSESITLWARAMVNKKTVLQNLIFLVYYIYYNNLLFIQVSQIKGVDENTPPPMPIFDKNKYRFPNSKKVSTTEILDSGNIL
jgi:hypothetical protein